MNDTPQTGYTDMDAAKVAALMAELHSEAAGDGEAAQPEGTFVSEDDASHPVATN